MNLKFPLPLLYKSGSAVGIATGYGLDGPGIESRWGEIFRTCPDRPWGPHSLLTMGTESFPGLKSGRGVTLTPHTHLVPWSWKGRPIPLLPLWAVRPVQSFSACTKVHFTFTLPSVTLSWQSISVAVYNEKHLMYIYFFTLEYSMWSYKGKASSNILCTPTTLNPYFNFGYYGEVSKMR
jgi:hypothetical protein